MVLSARSLMCFLSNILAHFEVPRRAISEEYIVSMPITSGGQSYHARGIKKA